MTIRTFKQTGQAYGATTCIIVASIDGNLAYSGPVPTLDQPLPILPDTSITLGEPIFSWQNQLEFEGTQTMTITVQGSPLLLTDTLANYLGNITANGGFAPLPGNDPLSNVTIDGVPMSRSSEPPGQWYWFIPVDSTFQATVTIVHGSTPPA